MYCLSDCLPLPHAPSPLSSRRLARNARVVGLAPAAEESLGHVGLGVFVLVVGLASGFVTSVGVFVGYIITREEYLLDLVRKEKIMGAAGRSCCGGTGAVCVCGGGGGSVSGTATGKKSSCISSILD